MSAITILGMILLVLMIIFGGKKGLVSFATLFLNFIILEQFSVHRKIEKKEEAKE